MEVNPPLDAMTLVRLAADRPAHELFGYLAHYLEHHSPQTKLKNFSVHRTPVLTATFTLPDEPPLADDRNHDRLVPGMPQADGEHRAA
jgi:hypothetical protein